MNNLDKVLWAALIIFVGAEPASAGGLPDARVVLHDHDHGYSQNYQSRSQQPRSQAMQQNQAQAMQQNQAQPSIVMNNYQQQVPQQLSQQAIGQQFAAMPPGNWVPCHDNPSDLCEYEIIDETNIYNGGYGQQQGLGQNQAQARAYVQPGFVQERFDIYSQPLNHSQQQFMPQSQFQPQYGVPNGYGNANQAYYPNPGAQMYGQRIAPQAMPYAQAY